MPVPLELSTSDECILKPVGLPDHGYRFTDIYEMLLNDTSLVESELLELHKLILKKINGLNGPSWSGQSTSWNL